MAKTFSTFQTELAQLWSGKAFSSLTSAEQVQIKLRFNLGKDYITAKLKELGGAPFLEAPGYISTTAKHTTGTISLTQYSTAVGVGSGGVSPAFAAAMANKSLLIVSSGTEPYRIVTRTDADNIVLATPYLGSTDANASYTIVYDLYNLASGFDGFIRNSVKIDGEGRPLIYKADEKSTTIFPQSTAIGTPQYYGLEGMCQSGTDIGLWRMWLKDGYPGTAMGIQYRYWTTVSDLSGDNDISLIGYVSGGDNALLLTGIWQLKEVGEEYDMNDRQIAKGYADEAIYTLYQNSKNLTQDAKGLSAKVDHRVADLSNW